jgi:hypothetical protein
MLLPVACRDRQHVMATVTVTVTEYLFSFMCTFEVYRAFKPFDRRFVQSWQVFFRVFLNFSPLAQPGYNLLKKQRGSDHERASLFRTTFDTCGNWAPRAAKRRC